MAGTYVRDAQKMIEVAPGVWIHGDAVEERDHGGGIRSYDRVAAAELQRRYGDLATPETIAAIEEAERRRRGSPVARFAELLHRLLDPKIGFAEADRIICELGSLDLDGDGE